MPTYRVWKNAEDCVHQFDENSWETGGESLGEKLNETGGGQVLNTRQHPAQTPGDPVSPAKDRPPSTTRNLRSYIAKLANSPHLHCCDVDSSDMNYDPHCTAEDGDQPKLVRTNESRARDDRPRMEE
ncbi:hypothetical protein AAG570_006916 [Ranatra chinensis]|uniref:Uncharacterized protein n=1 Tax=Ranatra chinensis TaxID=642074 RepID=A0ABD0YXK9_9HEMI